MIEKFQFTDKSFDLENINNYHLSLQVNLKGFSFCVLDRERNKFIALGNYYFNKITSYSILLDEINTIFQNEEILKHNYQHAKLLFVTPKYTYIPSPFFDQSEIENIYGLNHKLYKDDNLHTNYLYGNSSYTIYSIPSYIESFFSEKYSSLKIYHHSCPLIEEILLKDKLSTHKTRAFLNILPDIFDFIIIEDGKLKLFNSFAYKSETDFQYFVLNTFDQLKLSTIDIPVSILGFVKRDDQKIEYLKKFIKQIDYFSKPTHFEYAYGFNELPEHYFINLINLYQCG
ncbi:MAG: DUF3822 family protein [Salinivirgaceae bacterium]|nr:DUF3822 family protein [Salinivirgaceae bacterium]